MTESQMDDKDRLTRLRHGEPADRQKLTSLAAGDPAAAAELAEWDRQDAALAALYGPVANEPVPGRHRAVLSAAPRRRTLLPALKQLAAAVVLIGLGVAGGWTAATRYDAASPTTSLGLTALRAFATYAPEVRHPVEVAASDEPHLRTWLSKRLGHAFAPPDLQPQGFTLIGGRVIPGGAGTAAMMMYEDGHGNRVTLILDHQPGRDETALRSASSDGVSALWWVENDLGCAVAGKLPDATLRRLATAAYDQLS